MIRIYKDNDIKMVTQGAYNNLYKSLGYKIVLENTQKTVTKVETKPTFEKPKTEDKKVGTVTRLKKGSFKKNKKEE